MTEYQQLKAMLERSGTGFGLRDECIMVEGEARESRWGTMNFEFDEQGKLINVYQGEEG